MGWRKREGDGGVKRVGARQCNGGGFSMPYLGVGRERHRTLSVQGKPSAQGAVGGTKRRPAESVVMDER
jgi:hypothetical protein